MGWPFDKAQPSFDINRPDLNLNCTSYRQDYGKEGFSPCLGHHYGTGYSANLRPTVNYSSSFNQHDNPELGVSLLNSFQSQAQRLYPQPTVLNGAKVLLSTRAKSRETQSRPRTVSCQTEYKGSYVPHRPSVSVCRNHHIVGTKEESGFTEGSTLQHYTFLPQNIHMDEAHHTQSSVTRMDFLPTAFLQGSEMFPKLAIRASRESAFTRGTRDPLACPATLLVRPRHYRQKSSEFTERAAGLKEDSGFVVNTPTLKTLSHTPLDPLHYLTHYQNKFCDPVAFSAMKTVWKTGGIQTHRQSGYSGRDTDRFNLCGY